VAAPARVVGVGAEDGARRAAQLVELAVGGELGRRLLAVVVAVEGDAAQLPVRVPAARDADRAAVAVGLLAHEHRLGAGIAARVLARDAVAVAALVDAVVLLELAVLVVAHAPLNTPALQLLLAHDRPPSPSRQRISPVLPAVVLPLSGLTCWPFSSQLWTATPARRRRRRARDEQVRAAHRGDCAAGQRAGRRRRAL
jgi:hypothetical protein